MDHLTDAQIQRYLEVAEVIERDASRNRFENDTSLHRYSSERFVENQITKAMRLDANGALWPLYASCKEVNLSDMVDLLSIPDSFLQEAVSLNVSNCRNLKTLPLGMTKLAWLNCNNCISLESVPEYLGKTLEIVVADNCTNLHHLPTFAPKLTRLMCRNNGRLRNLPNMPECTTLYIGSCVLLKQFTGPLEKLKTIHAYRSPISLRAYLPSVRDVMCDNEYEGSQSFLLEKIHIRNKRGYSPWTLAKTYVKMEKRLTTFYKLKALDALRGHHDVKRMIFQFIG